MTEQITTEDVNRAVHAGGGPVPGVHATGVVMRAAQNRLFRFHLPLRVEDETGRIHDLTASADIVVSPDMGAVALHSFGEIMVEEIDRG